MWPYMFRPANANPCGAEAVIFRYLWVDTMMDDALAPCVARSSSTMVSIIQDMGPLSPDEWFPLSLTSVDKWLEMQLYILIFLVP